MGNDNEKKPFIGLYLIICLILGIAFATMLILNSTGITSIPFVAVFAPLWVPFILVAILLLVMMIVILYKHIKTAIEYNKEIKKIVYNTIHKNKKYIVRPITKDD